MDIENKSLLEITGMLKELFIKEKKDFPFILIGKEEGVGLTTLMNGGHNDLASLIVQQALHKDGVRLMHILFNSVINILYHKPNELDEFMENILLLKKPSVPMDIKYQA